MARSITFCSVQKAASQRKYITFVCNAMLRRAHVCVVPCFNGYRSEKICLEHNSVLSYYLFAEQNTSLEAKRLSDQSQVSPRPPNSPNRPCFNLQRMIFLVLFRKIKTCILSRGAQTFAHKCMPPLIRTPSLALLSLRRVGLGMKRV